MIKNTFFTFFYINLKVYIELSHIFILSFLLFINVLMT